MAPKDNEQMEDILTRITATLEMLAGRPQTSDTAALIDKLAPALERLAEAQLESGKLVADETRRAHRPSNEVVPRISVFNRRGVLLEDYQKPKLKCLMLLPWLADWDSLTREEVELLNLLEAGEYAVRRIDQSKVKVTVTIELGLDEKTPSRLILNHETAFNNDNFRLMPALSDILRQILKQHPAAAKQAASEVLSDEEEEALITAGALAVSA